MRAVGLCPASLCHRAVGTGKGRSEEGHPGTPAVAGAGAGAGEDSLSSQMPPSDHGEQIHLQKERRVSSLAGGGTEARSEGCFRGSAAQRRHTHRLQGSLPCGPRGSAMVINTLSQLEHKHVFSMKYILNYISVLVSAGYGSKGPQTGWLTAQNVFQRSPGGWKCRVQLAGLHSHSG